MKNPLFTLASFLSGVLFTVGLGISGMTHPSKVIGFLDLLGRWDPSLAFVMGGAVLVGAVTFRFILRRTAPVLAARFHLPIQTTLDRPLIVGSVLFGVGWGLSGYCPGPAIASLVTLSPGVLVFCSAMTAGMVVHHGLAVVSARRRPAPSPAVPSPT